jgi:excisionase family DNA binding protein
MIGHANRDDIPFPRREVGRQSGNHPSIGPQQLPPCWTPQQLASYLRVSADKVYAWINEGSLHAIDVRSPRSSRAQYRISEEAVHTFQAQRRAGRPRAEPRAERPTKRDVRLLPRPQFEYFK